MATFVREILKWLDIDNKVSHKVGLGPRNMNGSYFDSASSFALQLVGREHDGYGNQRIASQDLGGLCMFPARTVFGRTTESWTNGAIDTKSEKYDYDEES
jgi:hypothetical protein